MDKVDLHTHSTKSDGTMSPTELVEYAVKRGVAAIALTDHDTTDGIDEALAAAQSINSRGHGNSDGQGDRNGQGNKNSQGDRNRQGDGDGQRYSYCSGDGDAVIDVIPGIEFSTRYESREVYVRDVHILGLFIDHHSEFFKERLASFVRSRTGRNLELCEKLRSVGIDIRYEDLAAEYPDGVITRAHYASWLFRHGYTRSVKEGFERFLGDHAPCFIPRKKVTTFRAIELILKSGGIPILAHPLLYHISDANLDRMTAELTAAGLVGIEAVYSANSPAEERAMRKLANKYRLLISGGSDYHGGTKPGLELGSGYGHLFIPESILADLRTEWQRRHKDPDASRLRKILLTDLDGTLLDDQKQISPYTRSVLDKWHQAGHRLVLSSGRDINSVKEVWSALNLNYPGMLLCGSNGGRIYDCDKGELIYESSLTKAQALHIINAAAAQGLHCHSYDDAHIISPGESNELTRYRQVIHTPAIITSDLAAALPDNPCKCLVIELSDRSKLERFRDSMVEYAGDEITMLSSSPLFLELFPASSGKGNALYKLCEILDIPRGLTVAAGDQENDLDMLKAAGYSIAMCNGTELIRKTASTVTEFDNNHDGLAHVLERLI